MATYTLNNVNYTYTVGVEDASVGSSASATDDISLLSSFVVDGATYNVTSIAASAFYGATNLTSVTIPTSVTVINESAFEGCTILTTVNIPSVTTIGVNAFYGCSSLTSVTIPSTVTNILGNPFRNCVNLSSITVDANNTVFLSENGVLFDKLKQSLILYPSKLLNTSYVIPSTVESINSYAFSNCSNLLNVIFTGIVPTINGNNFEATLDTAVYDSAKNPNNVLDRLSMFTNTINQPTPTLTNFTLPSYTFSSVPFVITPPTSDVSGGVITYTSSNSAISTVSENMLTLVTVDNGTSYITATQTFTNFYGDLSFTTFTSVNSNALYISQATPSLSFSVPAKTFGDVSFNLVAPTSNSSGAFTYTSSNTTVATISGSAVTIVGVGTSTITASQESTTNFLTESINATLTVLPAPTITEFFVPEKTFGDVSFNLVAPTSNSDGAFTYTSSDTTVATISGSTVTIVGAGIATITVVQTSTEIYGLGSITAPLTVNRAMPVLIDFSVPSKTFGDVSFNLVAPTSNSSGAFTYTSSNTTVATIDGSTVTIIGAGTSTVTASQESTDNFLTESITATLTVNQALPVLTDFYVPAKIVGDASFNLADPTSNSDGAFTYTSSDTTVATISGSIVTIVGAGTTTITAVQASDTNYLTESITAPLTVNQATPVLTVFSVSSKTFGDVSFNLVAPTSNSDGAFTYTSSDTSVATIDGNTVTIVGGGSSTITAVQMSTANFLSGSITTTLTVNPTMHVLTDFSVPAKTFGDVSFNLVAPTSNSSGLFTYTSSDTTVATISGSMVTIVGVGTSTITAVQASTASYLTESITAPLVVNQATPTITNFSVSAKIVDDASFNLVDPTSNSTGLFTYTSSDITVATIAGNIVTIVGVGTSTITATQESTTNYVSGSIASTFIVRLRPVMTDFYVPVKSALDPSFNLVAPTTNSDGLITYTSSNTAVATISGSTVTIVGAGIATITAVQTSTEIYGLGSITTTLTIMNKVPISIGVGSGGNTIASSTDLGLRWTGRGATPFATAGYGVAGPATYADPSLNGKLMISSTSIFTSGFYKTTFTKPSVLFAAVHKIKYANGIWVVISSSPASSGNNLAISSDGITWTGKTVGSAYALSDIVYGNNTWTTITTGNDAMSSMIYYSTNNWSSFTAVTGITGSTFISYANGLWFMNYGSRIYSSTDSNLSIDGISRFVNRNNGTIFTTGFSNVAGGKNGIGSNLWIAVGSGGNTIAKSSNGFAWSGFTNSIFTSASDVAYANGLWIVCGSNISNNVLAISSDGTIFTTVLTNTSISLSRIVWTGSEWFVGGSGFITSTNGTNWNTCSTGISATSFDVGPSQTFTKPTFIAVGQGVNTMATSNNGTTWKGEGSDIFTTAGYGVAWNGTQWVAVGSGRNNIAYSSDGILWTGNSTRTFSTQGNDVAYGKDISGNGLWVVAGQGVNSIATSSDGLTWTGRGTTVFTTAGWCVAFGKDGSGNRLLVAVGQGTNTIATSTNGITWTGRGATIFTTKGIGVTYANNLWIAVGQGGNSIATSVNGINWTGLGSTIFTQGNGIRYTNNLWVATGTGANTIATSTNGTTWIGRGATVFTSAGQDVLGPTSVEPMMTFTVPPKYIEEASFTITPPTSNSSGVITYTSSNASVATVDGTTVTIVGPGTSTITANQESTDYYISGTISSLFTVNKLVTVLTNFSVPEKSIGDEAFTIIPPTSNSDGEATYTYTSSNTTVATIVGTTITIVGAGTTTITAFQASSARYTSATTTATFIVNKLITTLTDFSVPAKTFGDVSFNLVAPTINRDGAITYTSSNLAVATIAGSTVTIVGGGTSTITAFQVSTPIYASGTTTATLLVNQATTVLSNFSVPTKTFGNAAFNLVAPTTNGNGAITYTSSDTTVATVSGITITIVGGGTTIISANQASTTNYTAGTITATLIVNQATPTITNFVVPAKIIGDASFNLVNPTSNSSGLFTYTSSNTDVATIEGNVVTIIKNGIVTITASQASTNKYLSGSITGTLYVRLIPTITNFVIPTKTFGEVSYLYFPSPVSDSSGYYTFTSSNTTVATIYSNAVNAVNELSIRAGGTTTITAVQAMTDQYISGTITTTFTVNPATTVLSNFSVASRKYGDYSNINGMRFHVVPVTTNSNGGFTYTSSDTLVATITNGGEVTIIGGGTTTITATQAGTSNYLSASISAPFTVTPATGVLSNFSIPDKVVGDASFSITNPASANNYYASGNTGAFTYTSLDLTVATIQGNVITVVGNGISTITAFQAATANYTSASITTTFRVRLTPTLSNFVIPAKIFGDTDFTVTPPTTNSDGPFGYSSSNTAVAWFSGNVLKIVGGGTTTVTATQYSSNNYASKSITTTFTVNPATPVLTNFSMYPQNIQQSPYTIYNSWPTSNSSGGYTFTSSNSAVASIGAKDANGRTIINILALGSTTITAYQEATTNYTGGSISTILQVIKSSNALTNFFVPAKKFGDAPYTLSKPISYSYGAFTYTSSNPLVATISGEVITVIGIGSSIITANQETTPLYETGTTSGTLVVSQGLTGLANFVVPAKTFGDASFNLVAPTTKSDGAITYTSSNTAVATVTNNTVTIVGAGTSTITANQASATNYASGTISATLTVSRVTTAITNFSIPTKTFGDASFSIVAPTTDSDGAITYTSSNTAVATIVGTRITIVSAGTSTITASQSLTANYASGTITTTLIVNKATPTITNFSVITKTFGNAAFSLVAPTTNSTGAFTYTSSNTAVATIAGSTATIVGGGTVTITATQATTTNYLAGTITATLTVNKATPTITNFSEITKTFGNADFSLVAPTSNSAGSFTYTSSNTAVATIAGSTVTIVGGGTATITASQATTTNYLAGTTTATITVSKATPMITIFDVPAKAIGTAPFSLVAPISNSSGAFTYTSSNTSVATVDGSMVTIVGLGNTTITAVQASTTNYLSGSITGIFAIMTIVPLSIAVGSGENSIATSIDRGLTWTGRGTTVFTNSGSCVAFGKDGSGNNLLVAVGSGGNTIATSTNGFTWIGRGVSVFTSQGLGVAYANNLWVAVGQGTNSIATSDDGRVWTGRTGTSIFSNQGHSVAFNNGFWVAVGDGTNSIATSPDGIVWTGRGKTNLSGWGRGIAYGNGLWVAVGQGTNSIATSPDGVVWTGRTGTSIFSNQGIGVAFNNGLWVAVGDGTTTIATSTDGVNWTSRGKTAFSVLGHSVAFNSGLWIAAGQGTNSTATSPDGVVWTGRGTSIFSSSGFGVAVGVITPPVISSISPSAGAMVGGTSVTITGTNFTGATSVTFDGIAATTINVVNSTTITCITPARSAGAAGIIVTTEDGPSGEFSSFTYITPPSITGISPSSGSTEGGTNVTITGTSFIGATSVTFGGIAATSLSIVNSTTITCITPARSIGAVGIIVTTLYGTSGAFSPFTYITPPVISSISPSTGSTFKETNVTIRGTNFTGATSVTFDGIAATSLSVVNSTTITCITPARAAGAVDIIVTTGGGPSGAFSSFTYITPPLITDISPSSGSTLGGTTVTITGTNFTGATSVTFGGLVATAINVVNSTTITCITRDRTAGTGAVGIVVTTGGGPSDAFSSFNYITPPVISSILPLTGSTMGGTSVTITGTSFTEATLVSFSGLPATSLNVVNSTTITCITPIRSSGAAGVIVKTLYGTSVAFLSFTFITPPLITGISPSSGGIAGGTNVTITGRNFTGATSVTFGGLSATSLSVVNSTTITCITPVRSAGAAGIIVTTGGGPSNTYASFTYVTPPNITSISQLTGSTEGGTNVTITGTNFTGATSVTFDGLAATTMNVVNSTTITCISPAHITGVVGIIVTTAGGSSDAFSSFTYITPPNITDISSSFGSTLGGTNVTITGTNFTGATLVTFGGLSATSLSVVNSTTITCITPARTTAGAVGIIVTTGGGPSGAFSSFTYITPPNITSISQSSGSTLGGTNVTITGTNFTGATSVTFGGLAATAINVVNSTTITCITPTRTTAGAVGIIVTTGGGSSGAFSSFTYITSSVISSISPSTGGIAGGTSVTITGINFTGATSVTFDGIAATTINVVNSTTITCVTPARSAGAVGIIVTTGGGPSDAFSSFTYIIPPSITDISPSSGINTGGTSVTITGTNFTGATLVTFGGIAATTINVVNSTTITCITPTVPGDGAVGIIVTTGGGPSGVFSSFTYITSPVISSISPSSGGIAGETNVTIRGINFTGATSVTFDGIAATSLSVVNSTTITCITPAHTTAGAVGVIVTTGGGPSDAFSSFTYITPPNITGILSSSGSTLGGTNVTITGTNFTGATSVTFDGLAATTINVVNSTTIICSTPAHSAGAVNVIITTQGGSSVEFSSFTYITPPNITDILPSSGSTLGGTNVTITGTNFTGATLVTFGGIAATSLSVVNSTTITCITPARTTAGAVGIIVTTGGGPSGAFLSFAYITPPNITGISQLTGSTTGGTSVTITGTNFTGATSVTFDGLAATTVNVVNSTTITCITPAHSAGAVSVIVTTQGGPSSAFSSFTYITPPNITGISPLVGSTAGGTSVTITGTSFTGETSVTFDGLAATTINVVNSTTITCITPAHNAGAVGIIVTTDGRPSSAFSSFTYITPPNITGISPSSGSTLGGTTTTITGTNFTGATSVTFDGLAATSLNVVNSTTITCITPAHITGVVGIIVTTGGGPSTIFASSFTYNTPPNITGISPLTGSTAGGTSVTITGTSFTGATSVTFGGVSATSLTVVNSTTVTCITPARATAGAVGVIVTTGGGPSNTFASYTYILPPNIKSMTPSSVSRVGGTSITITGTNFIGATSVTLGGLNATSFNVVSNTSITCVTPARTTGGMVSVIVTTGGGPSNTFSTFIYSPFISAILPALGTKAGGTGVKITGVGFTGATSVTFGGVPATNVSVFNPTTITCKTAASSVAGQVGVIVTTGDGPSNTFASFTYLTPPNITGISPTYGGTIGGTVVTITGTSFTGVSIIKFGELKVKSLRVIDDTTITCVTAARTTSGPVDITVQNSVGISDAFSSFTYIMTPKITSISPNFGSTTGGNTVTITGTDFTGATEVMVGDLSCASITVVNSTTMTCITPARISPGPVGIIVTTGGGQSKKSSPFTYIVPPVITSISPTFGGITGGNVVTITGLNFKGANSVTFGGLNATLVKALNPTTITCKTPVTLTAGAVDVIVRTGGGPSNTFSSFTYITPPVISAISPAAGNKAGGNSVTITGTNLTGVTSVSFGKAVSTNITVVDDTTLTCITPLGAVGAAGVIVRTGGGPSNTFASFTFVTPASISSILPLTGSTNGGTLVTIKGKDFTGTTSVTVGGVNDPSFSVVSDILITCRTPARNAAGAVGIIVTTAGGQSKQFSFFNYITPPVITSILSSSGSIAGGSIVTITGTNFTGATSVIFNGKTATTIVIVDSTTITCKTPVSTSAGAADVIITTGGGPSNTFTGFTYVIPSNITSISPSFGPKSGGTSVTITGTNFTGASDVIFGLRSATNINVMNDTTITCETPVSTTPVAVGIIITTGGGPGKKFSSYTYR